MPPAARSASKASSPARPAPLTAWYEARSTDCQAGQVADRRQRHDRGGGRAVRVGDQVARAAARARRRSPRARPAARAGSRRKALELSTMSGTARPGPATICARPAASVARNRTSSSAAASSSSMRGPAAAPSSTATCPPRCRRRAASRPAGRHRPGSRGRRCRPRRARRPRRRSASRSSAGAPARTGSAAHRPRAEPGRRTRRRRVTRPARSGPLIRKVPAIAHLHLQHALDARYGGHRVTPGASSIGSDAHALAVGLRHQPDGLGRAHARCRRYRASPPRARAASGPRPPRRGWRASAPRRGR